MHRSWSKESSVKPNIKKNNGGDLRVDWDAVSASHGEFANTLKGAKLGIDVPKDNRAYSEGDDSPS